MAWIFYLLSANFQFFLSTLSSILKICLYQALYSAAMQDMGLEMTGACQIVICTLMDKLDPYTYGRLQNALSAQQLNFSAGF